MIDYKLSETRLRQYHTGTSAAGATTHNCSAAVPENKLWIIHSFGYYPSVAETKVVTVLKYIPAFGGGVPVINPVSFALDPAKSLMLTFIEQGMEYFLFPGQYLIAARESATAGSTMTAAFEFTEIDLPLYTYDEPQVVKRQAQLLSTLRARLGGGVGAGSVTRPPSQQRTGGGGRGLPK